MVNLVLEVVCSWLMLSSSCFMVLVVSMVLLVLLEMMLGEPITGVGLEVLGLVLVEIVDRLGKGVLVEIVLVFLLVFTFFSVSLINILFSITNFLRLFERILFFLFSSCISNSPFLMVLEVELTSGFKVLSSFQEVPF